MAKQFFKDLPDTSAPINSSRLNGLLDGDEAMGNLVVDSIRSKNMFNKDILITGYLYDNGNIYANTAWAISDYIPIEPNTAYTSSGFAGGSGNNPARCYYASDKTYISGVTHNSNNPFTDTAPANAYYMRESVKKDDIDTLQVEKGASATNYTSFQNLDNTSYVLYDNATGTNNNVTLSDNINNYSYIEVYFKRSTSTTNPGYSSTKFYPSSETITLTSSYLGISAALIYSTNYVVSGTNLSLQYYMNLRITLPGGNIVVEQDTNNLYITRVVGYK